MSEQLIRDYFDAFNRGAARDMIALLTEDVAHDINQGAREIGRERFQKFLAHMERCYREQISDLYVMRDVSGTRFAAEYMVHGTYLASDAGFPEARGQSYALPAGSFFEVEDGLIARVTTFYNVREWVAQVSR